MPWVAFLGIGRIVGGSGGLPKHAWRRGGVRGTGNRKDVVQEELGGVGRHVAAPNLRRLCYKKPRPRVAR